MPTRCSGCGLVLVAGGEAFRLTPGGWRCEGCQRPASDFEERVRAIIAEATKRPPAARGRRGGWSDGLITPRDLGRVR